MVTPIQEDQQPRRKERQRKTYPRLPVEGQFLLPKGFDPFAETKQPWQEPIPMGFSPDNFPQAQALNQQPDSIPAMMKPGEYVLPPDTVAAMGGPAALDAAVAQTHVPGNQAAVVPKGFKPKQFFDTGGLVEDEKKRQSQMSSPSNIFPNNRWPDKSLAGMAAERAAREGAVQQAAGFDDAAYQARVSQIPTDTGLRNRQPDAAPTPSDESFFRTTELGRNIHNIGMALPGVGGAGRVTATGGVIIRGLNTILGAADVASRAGVLEKQLRGDSAKLTTPPTPQAVAATARALEPAGPPASAANAGIQRDDLGPGVYQHGRGQYSDNPEGMGFATGFTGQPSAQNMQAANALASQQQAQSTARVQAAALQAAQQAAPQTGGFRAPTLKHSGNDWSTRQYLRSLRMAAEDAMESAPRKRYAAQHPAVQAYQKALESDIGARMGGQAALDMRAQEANMGMMRDSQANAIDQQRMAMEAEAKGFDIRAGKRKEAAQNLFAQATTDEQRQQIMAQFPDLFPAKAKGDVKTRYIAGGTDAMGNPLPGRVMQSTPDGTVSFQSVPGMEAQQGAGWTPPDPNKLKDGEIVVGPNGQSFKVDKKNNRYIPIA